MDTNKSISNSNNNNKSDINNINIIKIDNNNNNNDIGRRSSCGSLLIDFSVINDSDILIDDCQKFLTSTTDNNAYNIFPLMTRLSSNIKSWQTKRKDIKLMTIYEELYPRLLNGKHLYEL
jgi:hypothetical protein